jgi:hypothetical protein
MPGLRRAKRRRHWSRSSVYEVLWGVTCPTIEMGTQIWGLAHLCSKNSDGAMPTMVKVV